MEPFWHRCLPFNPELSWEAKNDFNWGCHTLEIPQEEKTHRRRWKCSGKLKRAGNKNTADELRWLNKGSHSPYRAAGLLIRKALESWKFIDLSSLRINLAAHNHTMEWPKGRRGIARVQLLWALPSASSSVVDSLPPTVGFIRCSHHDWCPPPYVKLPRAEFINWSVSFGYCLAGLSSQVLS